MKKTTLMLWGVTLLLYSTLAAQTQRQVGLRDNTPKVFAFVDATIVVSPDKTISNGQMLIRDGIIEAIGESIMIPDDAFVLDMQGKTLYPGFIELYSSWGLPSVEAAAKKNKDTSPEGSHWNQQIRAHYSSAKNFSYDKKEAAKLRSHGFVLAHVLPDAGIMAGKGSVVIPTDADNAFRVLRPDFSQALSFRRDTRLDRGYPTSVMGSIALLRQSFSDALWYEEVHEYWRAKPGQIPRPEYNAALEALAEAVKGQSPFVIGTADEEWFLRASALAQEFSLNLWVLGNGHEYKRPHWYKDASEVLILPLSVPDSPDLDFPEKALNVSLEELRHYYLAPRNAAKLHAEGIEFVLTSHNTGEKNDFLNHLRTAVQEGLPQKQALKALTLAPAHLLDLQDLYGTLEVGKSASFLVCNGNIFEKPNRIEQVWVEGTQHRLVSEDLLSGKWSVDESPYWEGLQIKIQQKNSKHEVLLKSETDTAFVKASDIKLENERLSFIWKADSIRGPIRFSGSAGRERFRGLAQTREGDVFSWTAHKIAREDSLLPSDTLDDSKEKAREKLALQPLFPAMEYGISHAPVQHDYVLIRNATIWTQGTQGILENADMLVKRGIIEEVGKNLQAPGGAEIIEAEGRHLTPGLIDPHLHTSIAGGVNETGDAITSETRIVDVLEANNVWLYRLLSGGLTTANLFHGSANPIGGQSAMIKVRWGESAPDLLMKDVKPGLKFALGENVKRTSGRYPNTRMGTEQIIKDALQAAQRHEKERETALPKGRSEPGKPFRRDLQLEPLVEVLNGTRLAHVHAYRQDEMLMIMRLAEEFGFIIASFEHTVEGYKIADELREHGAAAIVWTDWSSFKMEAYDAIHQNAKLLLDAGVLTSLHSDNTQLATRMNREAGKTLKGGVSPRQAMDLITLNPAKILQVDHRIGSLEAGKEADFVIWNGNPLSAYTIADQTWIEGRKYFDREDDERLRKEIQEERNLLIRAIPDMR